MDIRSVSWGYGGEEIWRAERRRKRSGSEDAVACDSVVEPSFASIVGLRRWWGSVSGFVGKSHRIGEVEETESTTYSQSILHL